MNRVPNKANFPESQCFHAHFSLVQRIQKATTVVIKEFKKPLEPILKAFQKPQGLTMFRRFLIKFPAVLEPIKMGTSSFQNLPCDCASSFQESSRNQKLFQKRSRSYQLNKNFTINGKNIKLSVAQSFACILSLHIYVCSMNCPLQV